MAVTKRLFGKNQNIFKEIGYVVIEKVENPQQWDTKRKNGEWIDQKSSKQMQITDKSQMEACLKIYSDVWGEKNSQYVCQGRI